MHLRKCIFSFVLLIGQFAISHSQQVRYLNTKDGLSSSQTFGIEKDHNGLLWFATNEGIDRFDGNDFRNYKLNPSTINPSKLGFRFNILLDTSGIVKYSPLLGQKS